MTPVNARIGMKRFFIREFLFFCLLVVAYDPADVGTVKNGALVGAVDDDDAVVASAVASLVAASVASAVVSDAAVVASAVASVVASAAVVGATVAGAVVGAVVAGTAVLAAGLHAAAAIMMATAKTTIRMDRFFIIVFLFFCVSVKEIRMMDIVKALAQKENISRY